MSTNAQIKDKESKSQHKSDQYFTFILDDEEYGIDILNVLEIRSLERMTAIPSAPHFIKGVINLRGTIIPVMDLRERFGIPAKAYTRSTVLIVVQIQSNESKKEMGIIVDAISDVYDIDSEEIQPKPEICNNVGHEYISGLANVHMKNKEKLIILLDVSKLMTLDDLNKLANASV